MPLTGNEMWAAVVAADNNSDGLFFYGVKMQGYFVALRAVPKDR